MAISDWSRGGLLLAFVCVFTNELDILQKAVCGDTNSGEKISRNGCDKFREKISLRLCPHKRIRCPVKAVCGDTNSGKKIGRNRFDRFRD